jgi:hypothetical protein
MLSRDGSVLAYRAVELGWNIEGASPLRTWRRDADHDAGGSPSTYPQSVDITDDNTGLLYTLYNLDDPLSESVPGVWYDVLP